MSSTPDRRLPIGPTLHAGWRLFLQSLSALFLPLWVACIVDAVPGVYAGGGLFTGGISWKSTVITLVAWLVEGFLYAYAIAKLDSWVQHTNVASASLRRTAKRAVPAVIIGDLIYNIAGWGGLLLFVVPGIILGTTLAFFAYAAVLDRKNILDALAYSHALAWPEWWRTSLVISVPAIVLLIYDVIAGWPYIMNAAQLLAAGQIPSTATLTHPWYDLGLMPLLGGIVWSYVLAVLYVQYRGLQQRAVAH